MGSAVQIVVELYEALSEKERGEVVEKILKAEKVVSSFSVSTSAEAKEFGEMVKMWAASAPTSPAPTRRGWKKPPYWTKTVDAVDNLSMNASGAEGKWGFEPGQSRPVLFGLNKPRHLYAVLKATPGVTATIADDDGYTVEVENAEVVMTSKEWADVRERLTGMLVEF